MRCGGYACLAEPVRFFWSGRAASVIGAALLGALWRERVRLLFWFLELEQFFVLVLLVLDFDGGGHCRRGFAANMLDFIEYCFKITRLPAQPLFFSMVVCG